VLRQFTATSTTLKDLIPENKFMISVGALVAASRIRDPPDRRGADVETDRSMVFGDRDVAGLGPVVTRCNLAAFRGSAKV
jgi:hypothetical protein